MKPFVKKNLIVITYFFICSFLIVKAEVDCIGVSARGWGDYFCSEMEYIFLKWLLMPTIFWMDLLDYAEIYSQFYEITVHAKFYLLVITFSLNTLLIFVIVQMIKRLFFREKAEK